MDLTDPPSETLDDYIRSQEDLLKRLYDTQMPKNAGETLDDIIQSHEDLLWRLYVARDPMSFRNSRVIEKSHEGDPLSANAT